MSDVGTQTVGLRSQRVMGTADPSVIKVSIIEDHAIVRAGLRMLLQNSPQMCVLWEAQSATEVLADPNLARPDVILLDLILGTERGLDHLADLITKFPSCRVLVLTAIPDMQQHLSAVSAGASGVIVKEEAPETLLKAVERVHAGESWLAPPLMNAVMNKLARTVTENPDPETQKISRLTRREAEIVALVSQGLNGERIAKQLKISEATVRNHLTSILAKLGLANKFELAVYAHRHGLGTVAS